MSAPRRPKQHWIPAVVLGGFSADKDRPTPRERRLQVLERRQKAPHIVTAKNLAYVRGLYDFASDAVPNLDVDLLDDTFNVYERNLPDAFSQIVDSTGLIPFEPWIRTLVPYVAGLTVRSPHFLAGSLDAMENVDVQMSRLMEMTRAVAPLMAADWHMIAAPPGSGFVINDRGLTWTQDEGDRIGIVVPINHSRALVILPNPDRYIARRDPDGIWRTTLPRRELSAEAVRDLNVVMAQTAVYWVAGASVSDLEGLTFGDGDSDRTVLGYTWPDRGPLGAHDQDWLAAMHYSQLALGRNDWQPFAIFSSVEPGVRLHQTPEGLFLHHTLEVL